MSKKSTKTTTSEKVVVANIPHSQRIKELLEEIAKKIVRVGEIRAVYDDAVLQGKFGDAHKFLITLQKNENELKALQSTLTMYKCGNIIKTTEELILDALALKEQAQADGSFIAVTSIMKEIGELKSKLQAERALEDAQISADDEISALVELISGLPDVAKERILRALE